jgi:hypothetical protein
MDRVLASESVDMRALPAEMCPVTSANHGDDTPRLRILKAHEALMSLGERNREEFRDVVTSLGEELLGS